MPKHEYETINFSDAHLGLIETANEIINEYLDEGFTLTVRQVYYQFVARGHLDNHQKNYRKVCDLLSRGRMGGLIDWNAIEDRTRNLSTHASWPSPASIMEASWACYAENPWDEQPYYIEAWIEKDALLGVLEAACKKYRLPWFSCRGYVSLSEMWGAANRLKRAHDAGKKVLVIHLGDHDPSGVDMSRDILDRLWVFTEREFHVNVGRLALTMAQVREHNPPPNPAKITDPRARRYIDEHGGESWELDALNPTTIRTLVEDMTEEFLDKEAWNASIAAEEDSKGILRVLIDSLDEE